MRVRVRLAVIARTTCTVVLSVVLTVAIVPPVSNVAMGQSGSGSQLTAYTAKDLHPSGFADSQALGIGDGQQVGWARATSVGSPAHAMLWRGSAGSVVDLHPSGFPGSQALGTSGGQQVGYAGPVPSPIVAFGSGNHAVLWNGSAASAVDINSRNHAFEFSTALGTDGRNQVGAGSGNFSSHALLWQGSPDSVVDLHPRFLDGGSPAPLGVSVAYGVSGGQQVGVGGGPPTSGRSHALLWTGSADSAVDLHPVGFGESKALATSGTQQVGSGVPANQSFRHALLWRGSAGSVVDLTPSGSAAEALGTNGRQQVGWAFIGGRTHAVVWSGSANSMVDLHRFLPQRFTTSQATAIDSKGNMAGWAFDGTSTHAFLWTPSAVAVIFLPGLLGSWTPTMRAAFESGPIQIPAIVSEFSRMFLTHLPPDQMKEDAAYDDVINTLKSKGIDLFVMPWDWADGGYQAAAADLDRFISDHNFDKVDIIAHSAGGVVVQQYIQNRLSASADPHVRNLILLGTPSEGSLLVHCLYYVEPLACPTDTLQAKLQRAAIQLVLSSSRTLGLSSLAMAQRVSTFHDLMPTFPYMRNFLFPRLPLFFRVDNQYLRRVKAQTASGQFQAAGITPYIVHGTGVPTPEIFVVSPSMNPLRPFRVLPPLTIFNSNPGGDDTVLTRSAVIPGFNDVPVPNATHLGGLFTCIKEAYPRLRDTGTLACTPQPRRANTYIDIQAGSPIRILLADPRGRLTGTEFSSGTDVVDIPTSKYFISDHPAIFVAEAIPGKYALEVLGIGSGGEFELGMVVPNAFPNGFDMTIQDFSGRIRPGQRLRFVFDAFAFQGISNLFAAFSARLEINSASRAFEMSSTFTLGPGGAISPATPPLTIQIGNGFLLTIPAGSFRSVENGRRFVFEGTVNGVALEANLTPTGGNTYSLKVEGAGARNLPRANPVEVRLGIGTNGGSVSLNAEFER